MLNAMKRFILQLLLLFCVVAFPCAKSYGSNESSEMHSLLQSQNDSVIMLEMYISIILPEPIINTIISECASELRYCIGGTIRNGRICPVAVEMNGRTYYKYVLCFPLERNQEAGECASKIITILRRYNIQYVPW